MRLQILLAAFFIGTILSAQPGSLDLTFDPGISSDPEGFLMAVAVQNDGAVIVAGRFNTFQGQPIRAIARLDGSGNIDPTFVPDLPEITDLYDVAIDDLGRIIVGGHFYNFDGTPISCIARLLPDGSRDPSFDPGSGANYSVDRVLIQDDGRILIAGNFTSVNGQPRWGLARLLEDGTLDTSLDIGTGFIPTFYPDYPNVRAIALEEDGDIYVGGGFNSYNGMPTGPLVRISSSGILEPEFSPIITSGFNPDIYDIVVNDEGIRITGIFEMINGQPQPRFAGLLPDGSLDPSFLSAEFPYNLHRLYSDSSGHLYVAGQFDEYLGYPRRRLVRVNWNGSIDLDFDMGNGFQEPISFVHDLAFQTDGKILTAGQFTLIDGVPRIDIARLHGGQGIIDCTDAANLGAFSGAIDLELAGATVGDQDVWYSFQTMDCVTLRVRSCNDAGVDYFAPGLFTSCPIDLDAFVYYTDTIPNSCLGSDNIIEFLAPGTYWLPLHTLGGAYQFDLIAEPCVAMDCLGELGGPALPGTQCDDGDPLTSDDTYTEQCECIGYDCLGQQGGSALPGSACDDGNILTTNDTYTTACTCEGTAVDCEGVAGGTNVPGTGCDDGILFSINDTWTTECECLGFDCANVQGGIAYPATPCDDGINWTYNDVWDSNCECHGVGNVGIEESNGSTFSLHPNPTNFDQVEVVMSRPYDSGIITLFDLRGRSIDRWLIPSGSLTVTLALNELVAGTYLMEVQHQEGRYVSRLVVK